MTPEQRPKEEEEQQAMGISEGKHSRQRSEAGGAHTARRPTWLEQSSGEYRSKRDNGVRGRSRWHRASRATVRTLDPLCVRWAHSGGLSSSNVQDRTISGYCTGGGGEKHKD